MSSRDDISLHPNKPISHIRLYAELPCKNDSMRRSLIFKYHSHHKVKDVPKKQEVASDVTAM